ELVVHYALEELQRYQDAVYVVDVGTGSGAIALSIAHENPVATVVGIDISSDALQVAQLNAIGVGSAATRVRFLHGDIYEPLEDNLRGKIHLIISNPPYIGYDEIDDLEDSVVEYEPRLALFSGDKGQD